MGIEYVYEMCVSSLKKKLEQHEMNAARYTVFKSVTVTGTVTVTHN
jgi:hypothetical protein